MPLRESGRQRGARCLALVACLCAAAGVLAGAASAGDIEGSWSTDAKAPAGTVLSSGAAAQEGAEVTITRVSQAAAARAMGNPKPADAGAQFNAPQYACLGGLPKDVPAPRPTAWYVVTLSWDASHPLGACASDRSDMRGGINAYDATGRRLGVALNSGTGVEALTGALFEADGSRVLLWGLKSGCQPSRETALRRAINEVRVISCVKEADWRKTGEADWRPLKRNQVLGPGDEVSTDPDGSVEFSFADNTTFRIGGSTQLQISSLFSEGGVVRVELLLRNGEITSKVERSETIRSDFRVKGPSAASSVRGTEFTVFADAASGSTITSVTKGTVLVDPVKPGLKTVAVSAGKEVEVVPTAIGKPVGVGKAGAVRGLNRSRAVALVLAALARGDDRCKVQVPRTGASAVAATAAGWRVSVRLAGKLQGTATWLAAGAKASPQNALARRIAAGCR